MYTFQNISFKSLWTTSQNIVGFKMFPETFGEQDAVFQATLI